MFKHLGVELVEFVFGVFDQTVGEVAFAEQHGVFDELQVLHEVEILHEHLQHFLGRTEVSLVDPHGESPVRERIQGGLDCDGFDSVGDRVVALAFDEVDALARDEDLERQVETDEERDEVHENLVHFVPAFFFGTVFIFADEELIRRFIESAFVHPEMNSSQNWLIYFQQKFGTNFVYILVTVLLHSVYQGGERLLLE